MPYVDIAVIPVPKKNLAAYLAMARKVGKVWMSHGALEYRESVADEVTPGQVTSFPQSVQLKSNETIVLASIVFKSKAHRKTVHARARKDPRMGEAMNPKKLPFDFRRMIFGGFTQRISL